MKVTDFPYIELQGPIRAYCTLDPATGEGCLNFKVADSMVDVKVDDERVGSFGGAFRGFYELNIGSKTYMVRGTDLWNSFCDAVGRPDLKFVEGEDRADPQGPDSAGKADPQRG